MSELHAPWTYFADLAAGKADDGRARQDAPQVKMLGQGDRARVIRLAFAAGDTMADHQAPAPILVLGQVGHVEFTVLPDADDASAGPGAAPETVVIQPGTAIHVEARRTHNLHAVTDATVTLVLLTD